MLLGSVDIIADPAAHGGRLSLDDRGRDGEDDGQRVAADLDPPGGRGCVRPPGRSDDRGADRSRRRREPALGRLSDGQLGRGVARLSRVHRGPSAPGRRRDARRPDQPGARRRGAQPGSDQGDLDQRPAALDSDQPPGGALHRAGRARRVHPRRASTPAKPATSRPRRSSSAAPCSSPSRAATTGP